MASDRVYVHGGASRTDGNYERTDDISSRALRLICMERGHWPAARGKSVGCRLYELDQNTEENRNAIPGIIEEALQPLVNEGLITDISTEVHNNISGITSAVGFVVSYTNLITGDSEEHEIPAPWTR